MKKILGMCMFFALFGMILSTAWAQSLDQQVSDCSAIENDVERLSCFDNAAAMLANAESLWEYETEVNPVTDEMTATLTQRVAAPSGDGDAALFVRCKGKTLEMIASWDTYLGDEKMKVTHRLDRREPVTRTWNMAQNGMALFYPNADIAEFLPSLFDASSLSLQTTPENEAEQVITFELEGLEDRVEQMKRVCDLELG